LSYSSSTTSCFVQSAVQNVSLTSGCLHPVGPLVMRVVERREGADRPGIYAGEFTAGGARAGFKQPGAGAWCGPLASQWGRGRGRGGWLPLRARHVPRWSPIRPSARGTDGQGSPGQVVDGRFGAESLGCICVAVRGRSARGKVVGAVAWAGCMDRPPTRTNVPNVGVDPGRGGLDPGSARTRRELEWGRRGGLDAGLARSARAGGGREEGWAPWRSQGQRSNLGADGWPLPVGGCRSGTGDETGGMETVAAMTERFQVCQSNTVLEEQIRE
jgi:hypothetical protein